jgi:DNA-directed RNA polymerase specialized sigma24 family protein
MGKGTKRREQRERERVAREAEEVRVIERAAARAQVGRDKAATTAYSNLEDKLHRKGEVDRRGYPAIRDALLRAWSELPGERREDEDLLYDVLRVMDDQHPLRVSIVILHMVHGRSVRDIAADLMQKPSTVQYSLTKCMNDLRARYQTALFVADRDNQVRYEQPD